MFNKTVAGKWNIRECMCGFDSALTAQVTPILAELREGNLVGNLDALTASASLAAADIHQLQNDVRFSSEKVPHLLLLRETLAAGKY